MAFEFDDEDAQVLEQRLRFAKLNVFKQYAKECTQREFDMFKKEHNAKIQELKDLQKLEQQTLDTLQQNVKATEVALNQKYKTWQAYFLDSKQWYFVVAKSKDHVVKYLAKKLDCDEKDVLDVAPIELELVV